MSIVPSLNDIRFTLSGKSWEAGGKVSFNPKFNTLVIYFTPDMPLQYVECRITFDTEDYGIGVGNRAAYLQDNISGGTEHSLTINVNGTNFDKGDGLYRLSIYAKNSTDGTWNQTYFFLTVDAEQMYVGLTEYTVGKAYNCGTYLLYSENVYEVIESFTAEQNTSWNAIYSKVGMKSKTTESAIFMVPTDETIPAS